MTPLTDFFLACRFDMHCSDSLDGQFSETTGSFFGVIFISKLSVLYMAFFCVSSALLLSTASVLLFQH